MSSSDRFARCYRTKLYFALMCMQLSLTMGALHGQQVMGVDKAADSAPIRDWKVRIVDAESESPISNARVTTNRWVEHEAKPELVTLTATKNGLIEIPIRDGKATSLQVGGYFRGGYLFVGNGLRKLLTEEQRATTPVPDPNKPAEIKFWKGEVIRGRLLYPDSKPAAGQSLTVGAYINNVNWKEKLGMNLTWNTFDRGDWPNWSAHATTDSNGEFSIAVPPTTARAWVRVGTTGLGFSAISLDGVDRDGSGNALANYVPLEAQLGQKMGKYETPPKPEIAPDGQWLLKLRRGVPVKGRVVDADGNPLSRVHLTTPGLHGPHSGRSVVTSSDGSFRFAPITPGPLWINVDARIRDKKGTVMSRQVQAVFVNQSYQIPQSQKHHLIAVRAVDSIELKFDYVDRRKKNGQAISYYGEYQVWGSLINADGESIRWRGVAERDSRAGKSLIVVRVPKRLDKLNLRLTAGKLAKTSYEDETGRKSGPGVLELDDFAQTIRRTIYSDDP